jgi:hypothetical protein
VGVSLRDTGALTPAAEAFLHQLRAEAARLRAEKPGDGMTRHNQTG